MVYKWCMSKPRTRTNVSLNDEERELLMHAAELTGDRGYTVFIRRMALAEAKKIIAAESETSSGRAKKGNQPGE